MMIRLDQNDWIGGNAIVKEYLDLGHSLSHIQSTCLWKLFKNLLEETTVKPCFSIRDASHPPVYKRRRMFKFVTPNQKNYKQ